MGANDMNKEKREYKIEWLERLRNLSPEQKEQYLERKWKDGRKQAHPLLEKRAKPAVSLEELREMMEKELDGKSLGDLVIEERRKKPY